MEQIPFQDLLDDCLAKGVNCLDAKRGNYQVSYGFAGGQCYEVRNDASILKHFGTAIPALRKDTEKFKPVMELLSQVAEEVAGMCHTNPDLIRAHTILSEHQEFVQDKLGPRITILAIQKFDMAVDPILRNSVEAMETTT